MTDNFNPTCMCFCAYLCLYASVLFQHLQQVFNNVCQHMYDSISCFSLDQKNVKTPASLGAAQGTCWMGLIASQLAGGGWSLLSGWGRRPGGGCLYLTDAQRKTLKDLEGCMKPKQLSIWEECNERLWAKTWNSVLRKLLWNCCQATSSTATVQYRHFKNRKLQVTYEMERYANTFPSIHKLARKS